jgi:hypothetical protein
MKKSEKKIHSTSQKRDAKIQITLRRNKNMLFSAGSVHGKTQIPARSFTGKK